MIKYIKWLYLQSRFVSLFKSFKFRSKSIFLKVNYKFLQENKKNIVKAPSPWRSKFFKEVRLKYFKIKDIIENYSDQVKKINSKIV